MKKDEKNIENIEDIENLKDFENNTQDSMFLNDLADETIKEEFCETNELLEEDKKPSQEATEEHIEENLKEIEEENIEDNLNDIFEYEDVENSKQEVEKEPVETKEEVNQNIVSTIDELEEENQESNELITVRPVKFQEFEQTPPKRTIKKNLDILQDISMHVSVELGRTKSSIKEVMELEQGSIVELDKIAGEQVEIFINGKLVAKGEVIVIEDKFGVRVTSTNITKEIE